ncbi:uncharacterized protein BT62DRAFT_934110 [Guyanagaster necrorhizus]|uniref:Uncharacterized protein n=1 Tax=Guyanagaster necrorhizus TaxID=856835 RepID=A0A9P7VPS6_9AGAR|nr:uncharacterized protein BT62DRAFT_934110 [Guyanagaster necrorhizus MCA 3950]KAG7444458.1 hypothetical protein BT62DRAFT_934110 [Guyanagaster necrorhizus MCA 3950]
MRNQKTPGSSAHTPYGCLDWIIPLEPDNLSQNLIPQSAHGCLETVQETLAVPTWRSTPPGIPSSWTGAWIPEPGGTGRAASPPKGPYTLQVSLLRIHLGRSRSRTTEQSKYRHPTIDSLRIQVLLPMRLTEKVEDDVAAFPVGDFECFCCEVLGFVVDSSRQSVPVLFSPKALICGGSSRLFK